MSAPKVSSLSDLAKKCLELEKLMNKEDWDRLTFVNVKRLINDLQVDCPKEDSILDARIKWFERGLANFIDSIPVILQTPEFHQYSLVSGQIMDLDTINTFLRPSYLSIFNRRNEFPRLYMEVFDMCTRTM